MRSRTEEGWDLFRRKENIRASDSGARWADQQLQNFNYSWRQYVHTVYTIHVACMTGPPSTLYTVHIEKRVQVMRAVPGGGLYAVQHAWGRSISIMDTRGGYLCPYMGITSPRQQICPPQNRFHTVQKVILISAI